MVFFVAVGVGAGVVDALLKAGGGVRGSCRLALKVSVGRLPVLVRIVADAGPVPEGVQSAGIARDWPGWISRDGLGIDMPSPSASSFKLAGVVPRL